MLKQQHYNNQKPGIQNQIAPRPITLAETGLSDHFTYELIAKHLYSAGVLTLHELSERIALAGTVLEEVIGFLRQDAYIEVRGAAEGQEWVALCTH